MNNKLKLNTSLLRKESEFLTKSCVVEKAISVSHGEFEYLKSHPLCDNALIAKNAEMMFCDCDDIYHCLLIYDEEQGDGLLIESEGAPYARYAQYIPRAKELVERYQSPEISLTNGEKKLHKMLNEISDRITEFSHSGHSEFSFDDVLQDLGCDFDDVRKMLVESTAEILNERNDIRSVKINDLGIPFQPEITVKIESSEELSEETEFDMTI